MHHHEASIARRLTLRNSLRAYGNPPTLDGSDVPYQGGPAELVGIRAPPGSGGRRYGAGTTTHVARSDSATRQDPTRGLAMAAAGAGTGIKR